MMNNGVYAVWRVGDDEQPEYVGSGTLLDRKRTHEACSHNKPLRELVAEHGAKAFRWEVIEEFAPANSIHDN